MIHPALTPWSAAVFTAGETINNRSALSRWRPEYASLFDALIAAPTIDPAD